LVHLAPRPEMRSSCRYPLTALTGSPYISLRQSKQWPFVRVASSVALPEDARRITVTFSYDPHHPSSLSAPRPSPRPREYTGPTWAAS